MFIFKKLKSIALELTKSTIIAVVSGAVSFSALSIFYGKYKAFLESHMNFFCWLLIISLSALIFFIIEALLQIGKPPYRPQKFAYTLKWRKNPEGVMVPLCQSCGDFLSLSATGLYGTPDYFCKNRCRNNHVPLDPATGKALSAASVHLAMNPKLKNS